MFPLLRRAGLTLLFAGLVTSNVLTLTSAVFNTAVSSALATAFGVRTVTGALTQRLRASETRLAAAQATRLQRQAAARRFGQSLVSRSRRVAARSVAAIPVESLPYVGVAAIVAGTSYELYAMCETLGDLNQLYAELGLDEDVPDDAMSRLCNPAELLPALP